MKVEKIAHSYKNGPNKGKVINQIKCSNDSFSIIISELIGSDLIGLSFCSSGICDVESMEDGVIIAQDILNKSTHPDIQSMRRISQGSL